jgi:hypothetical protein
MSKTLDYKFCADFLQLHDPASLESFVMATSPLISQKENIYSL